jgi:hypothetical protein
MRAFIRAPFVANLDFLKHAGDKDRLHRFIDEKAEGTQFICIAVEPFNETLVARSFLNVGDLSANDSYMEAHIFADQMKDYMRGKLD